VNAKPARVVMAAGEASGDMLAGLVLPALLARLGDAQCAGIGGEHMIGAGFDAWWHVRELSVRGYAEVLRHLPRLLRVRRQLMQRALAWHADVYVGIDAPDFNLGVQAKLRARGIRTIQYVAPAVWAWRPERIAIVARAVGHLLPVFPFEEKLFTDAGVRTTYVGHPLASTLPQRADVDAARTRLGIDRTAPTVAVLPGSRIAEVRALGPAFCETIAWLQRRDRTMQFVVPAAGEDLRAMIEAMLDQTMVDRSWARVVPGRSHDCLEAADVVLVAAGTATLEAMLFGKPMVIAYKVPWLTAWMTARKALIPYFGLPNILAGRHVVPEFVQEEVAAEQLGPALAAFLDNPALTEALRERFAELRATLRRDTPGLVAQAIAEAVGR
jgi:lipid-A-disaccharide synthase